MRNQVGRCLEILYTFYIGSRNDPTLFLLEIRSRVVQRVKVNSVVVGPEMIGIKIVVKPVLINWSAVLQVQGLKGADNSEEGSEGLKRLETGQ